MKKYELFYDIVRKIPRGKVATYGQIADLAGYNGQARQVGYALNALKENSDVPWQRVINSKGEISSRGNMIWEDYQKSILESEGIVFNEKGKINLTEYLWDGD